MNIRPATLDDVEAIVALGAHGHSKSKNARFDFSGMRARLLVAICVCRRSMCAFVAVKEDVSDGGIVGFILGNSEEYPYIAMRYATDLALYAEAPGSGRKLIERFTRWAFEEAGVDQIILGVIYGGRSERGATALYKRMGYEHVGGMFTRSKA